MDTTWPAAADRTAAEASSLLQRLHKLNIANRIPIAGRVAGMLIKLKDVLLVAGLAVAATAATAHAQQNYPNRPITLLIGVAPGGITDISARIYADVVGRLLGQRLIVENRSGGGGGVAASAVQNAAPDGYTLLVLSGAQHAIVPAVGNAPYDPVKGFSPITFLFSSVNVLVVPADSPAKSMAELYEWGRKKPGGLTFGTPGLGTPSHLLGARLLMAAKVPYEAVHYRGGSQTLTDLLGGRVDFGWPTLTTSGPSIAEGKLRALATEAPQRWSRLPDVPTLDELGYGNEKVAGWFGLVGPAGMPPALVSRIRDLFVQASKEPELQRRLTENGTLTTVSTTEEMGRAMVEEWNTMQQLAKALNLRQQ